jgi:hypothetical protein
VTGTISVTGGEILTVVVGTYGSGSPHGDGIDSGNPANNGQNGSPGSVLISFS